MKEKRIQKTVTLYESLVKDIQEFADKHYDEDFSQALRKIAGIGLEKIESKNLDYRYWKELPVEENRD